MTRALLTSWAGATGRKSCRQESWGQPACSVFWGEELGTCTAKMWAPPSLRGRQGVPTDVGPEILSQTAGSRQRTCCMGQQSCVQAACMLVSWTAALGGRPAPAVGKQRCRHQRLLLQLARSLCCRQAAYAVDVSADLTGSVTVQLLQPRHHVGGAPTVCRAQRQAASTVPCRGQHALPDLVGRGCAPGPAWQPPCAVCVLSSQR